MGRYLWVLFLLTCQGSLYAGEPTAISQERRAGFAYARDLLTKKGVPFDPDLLLQEDWRTRLAGTFDSMPEMRAEREELSGKLKGVYLAGTLVLPEKIILAGDVVILARRVVFLGQNVMIVGPGKSVGFFPIEAVAHGRNAEASPAERHVTIITGSLIPVRPQHEDVMREAQALLCASLDSCDPWKDGYNGVWGERGIDGTDGATGTPGANGAWGSCQGNRDGSPGNEGEWVETARTLPMAARVASAEMRPPYTVICLESTAAPTTSTPVAGTAVGAATAGLVEGAAMAALVELEAKAPDTAPTAHREVAVREDEAAGVDELDAAATVAAVARAAMVAASPSRIVELP